ncbi:uncharacterized protein LOC121390850 isoform X2 [Gigantopelta aegis]|nr:uncharacterized protein LOC121390850 isoform X2 [Gigantopelta aegis]
MMGSSYKVANRVTLTFETDYGTGNSGRVALIGSIPELGAWEPKQCILAEEQPRNSNHWATRVVLPENTTILWKWIIVSPDRENVYRWEECENRKCSTGRSDGRWEAKWNCPANFYSLMTTEKTNSPVKKDGKVKEDHKPKEECKLQDGKRKEECKIKDGKPKDDYKPKEECKLTDGKLKEERKLTDGELKEERKLTDGELKEERTPREECNLKEDGPETPFQNYKPTFIGKMRDRLCSII